MPRVEHENAEKLSFTMELQGHFTITRRQLCLGLTLPVLDYLQRQRRGFGMGPYLHLYSYDVTDLHLYSSYDLTDLHLYSYDVTDEGWI